MLEVPASHLQGLNGVKLFLVSFSYSSGENWNDGPLECVLYLFDLLPPLLNRYLAGCCHRNADHGAVRAFFRS